MIKLHLYKKFLAKKAKNKMHKMSIHITDVPKIVQYNLEQFKDNRIEEEKIKLNNNFKNEKEN